MSNFDSNKETMKHHLACLALILTLFSCLDDETNHNDRFEKQNLSNELLKSFNHPVISSSKLNIDWNNPKPTQNGITYNILNQEQKQFSESAEEFLFTYQVLKQNDEFFLIKTIQNTNQKNTSKNKRFVYLQEERIDKQTFRTIKKREHILAGEVFSVSDDEFNNCVDDIYCNPADYNIGGNGGGNPYSCIYTHHYKDIYNDFNQNGIAEPNEYQHTIYLGHSQDCGWHSVSYYDSHSRNLGPYPDPQQQGGIHGGGSGGNDTPNHHAKQECINNPNYSSNYCNCMFDNDCEKLEDQWEEENIDYNALPDCIAQLVQDMINCDNSDIGNLIKQFDKDGLLGDNFNLIFNTGNLDSDAAAETSVENEWTDYTITFDINNNKNHTNLSLYATIAHEAVHAILFFRLYTDHPRFAYKYGNDYSSLTFNEVFNLYAEQFPDDYKGNNHHHFMANKVIDLIAQSVKEMDNGAQSDEFYWNLAWGGLKNTDVWTNFITQTSIDPNWSLPATTSAYRYNINLNRLKNIEQTLFYEELYTHNKSKGKKVLDSNGNCQ